MARTLKRLEFFGLAKARRVDVSTLERAGMFAAAIRPEKKIVLRRDLLCWFGKQRLERVK